MDKITKEKYELVKAMNTIVKSLNNEEAYYNHWIYIVPDGADDDDLYDIATDEELFNDTVKCFKRNMREYLKDGIYVGGNEVY